MKLINRRGRSSLPQSAEVTVSVIHQYSDHVHNRNNVSHVMLHNHNKYVILYPMQESENGTARQCPNPTDTCYQTIQMNPEGDGFMIRKGCMNLVRYDITLLPDDFVSLIILVLLVLLRPQCTFSTFEYVIFEIAMRSNSTCTQFPWVKTSNMEKMPY